MATQVQYSDPSLQILSLLSNLGGTQQAGTSTSTSSPAATAALEAILKTQMGQTTPEGMTAIINSIFQQGMRQVPKLGMQYAQAAGARTSKNSPLAYASENLQRQLSEAAASALLTAQQQASNTAAQLANSSKTTTTSQTSKPKNQGLMALPFLLGQAGNLKKGITDLKDFFSPETAGTGFGSVPGGSGVDGFTGNNPSSYIAPAMEASSGIDPNMFAGADLMFDAGSLFTPMTDAVSNAASFDFSGMDGFDLGAFFADGGLVSKKQMMKKKAPGYADGGQVRGENTLTPTGTTELNMFNTSPSAASDAAFGGGNAIPSPQMSAGPSLEEDVLSYFAANKADLSGSGFNVGNMRQPMSKNGVDYQFMPVAQDGASGESTYTGISPQLTEVLATPSSYDKGAGTMGKAFDRQTGNATRNVMIRPETSDMGMILSAVLAAIGMATGNPALAFAKTVGTRTAGEAAQGMFANGGEVDGPGHGTSDSIPIRVSDGEYIIPADTVEMFGVEFFDMLKDSTHTPASMQRFHAPGTSRNQQR